VTDSTILSVVERFGITVEGPAPDRDSWFLDYVLRSPNQAGRHLTAGWLALNSLKEVYRKGDDITDVHECFGGMGAQALMIEHLFNTVEHNIGEYNWDAVTHLDRLFAGNPMVHVSMADAYGDLNLDGCDLVMLDFGDLTAWKTRDGEKHRGLLDKTFAARPKAVVFTDIACRYLHLHRERYETLLGEGTCGSYETYLRALLHRFEGLYGYRLHEGYFDRWSAVMALIPDDGDLPGQLLPTPDSPVGLEVL
jgi:hypothetical protein